MIGLPNVTMACAVAIEPQVRVGASGKPWTSVRCVARERRRDPRTGEWGDGDAVWLDVKVFGDAAQHVVDTVRRGTRLVVVGSLHQREYEHDGQKRTALELHADEVALSLQFGPAQPQQRGSARAAEPADEVPW